MKAKFELMTLEDFPWGLRCGMCHRDILPGQPYTDTIDGMVEDSVSTIIVCVYC